LPASVSADEPSAGAVNLAKGDVTKYSFKESKIFPGTVRDYWIYVPKQYDPAKPACVYVNQDGVQYKAPAVFDELIAKREMPVTIGVFVTPGRVPAPNDQALDRFNRSLEYDGLGDHYARFLLDELLPDVEKKTAPDGRPLRLSRDGNDRAIGGSSSGAICAFTAAWERPDAFSRVFSSIGTYVGLRGGNAYPTLVRKVEPKPLRVFLQDGSGDLNIYGGDWWMANQEMERALLFAGYEVNHAWGEGGHNGEHATQVFPDAMRWLWKDWPAPVKSGAGSQQLKDIVTPGETWKLVGEGFQLAAGGAANAQGEVQFLDLLDARAWKIGLDGKPIATPGSRDNLFAEAFSPDGKLFAVADDRLVRFDGDEPVAIAKGFRANDLAVRHDGRVYATTSDPSTGRPFAIAVTDREGNTEFVESHMRMPAALAFSPDQTLLYVADGETHWVYSFQIQANGKPDYGQRYYHIHSPDSGEGAGIQGLEVDRDGRLYVATAIGVQVCDQAGRVNCILPPPHAHLTGIAFGGEDFSTLYAICGEQVYSRKLKVKGAPSFLPPNKPAAPKL
jgi:enterochelin esterase-like enzyme